MKIPGVVGFFLSSETICLYSYYQLINLFSFISHFHYVLYSLLLGGLHQCLLGDWNMWTSIRSNFILEEVRYQRFVQRSTSAKIRNYLQLSVNISNVFCNYLVQWFYLRITADTVWLCTWCSMHMLVIMFVLVSLKPCAAVMESCLGNPAQECCVPRQRPCIGQKIKTYMKTLKFEANVQITKIFQFHAFQLKSENFNDHWIIGQLWNFSEEVVYLYKQQEHTILNPILTSAPISNCLMFTLTAMTIDKNMQKRNLKSKSSVARSNKTDLRRCLTNAISLITKWRKGGDNLEKTSSEANCIMQTKYTCHI